MPIRIAFVSSFALLLACHTPPRAPHSEAASGSPSAGAGSTESATAASAKASSNQASGAQAHPSLKPDPPMVCAPCDEWNVAREPFPVYGNTYFVGTAGLSSILLTGNEGSVLIDGGLSQSAPLIAANIQKLGFRLEDVRLILNSHTHYDHAGGIAALQRASEAKVLASPPSQQALLRGEPTQDDPQYGFGHEANAFPSVPNVEQIADGQTLRVGDIAITAHFTPGHTPGSTSWTWRSCEGQRCLDVVYADSLTAISAPGFRYSAGRGERAQAFRSSIESVAQLPCDILLAPHPGFLDLDAKLAARKQTPATNPFIDAGGCKAYAQAGLEGLERRLGEEQGQ